MVDQAQVGAHQRQHLEDAGASRVHADVADRKRLACAEARGDQENSADEMSPGTRMFAACSDLGEQESPRRRVRGLRNRSSGACARCDPA